MRKTLPTLLIIILTLLSLSCTRKESSTIEKITDSKLLLGTICSITLFDSDDEQIIQKAFLTIEKIEQLMSREIKTSDVSKISTSDSATFVDSQTMTVIKEALEIAQISDGRFDPSIGPVVEAWGIGTDDARIPTTTELNTLLSHVDYQNILIDPLKGTISLADPEMEIDLGGIAKGYAADKTVEILEQNGVTSALINLGGNIFAMGKKTDGSLWKIGIQDPESTRGEYMGIVNISDLSVVTSGIYERFFEDESGFYHHILDTKTGYPVVNTLSSVSIISPISLLADGLSTAAFASGINEGRALIEQFEDVEAIFITKDKRVYVTSGLSEGKIPFSIVDDSYVLQNE